MLEQAVRELNTQVGIPAKLSDAGVTDEHFSQMTDDAHEKRKHCGESVENWVGGYSGAV